jgi:hypothetical protein
LPANPRRTSAPGGDEWIFAGEAAAILKRSKRVVTDLARDGHIRAHALPGHCTKYLKSDVEKLAPPPA